MNRSGRAPGVGVLLILVVALLAPVSFADDDVVAIPLEVERIDRVVLHDAARSRTVISSVLVPVGKGPFPLIVFSHGYGGSKDHYQLLTEHWASRGYVVVQPSHADAGAIRNLEDVRQVRDIWIHQRPPQWRDRVEDVRLIIDSIDDLGRRHPQLRGKIDSRRIGVAGHSYGALTTQLISGAVSFAAEPPLRLGDPRITAAIALSPEGTSEDLGFTSESFRGMTIPMMFMSGSLDRAAGGQPGEWRKEAFQFAPAGGKYLVFIEGARHASFSGRLLEQRTVRRGRVGRGRPVRRSGGMDLDRERAIFGWTQEASLAFWDAALKNSETARRFLASGELPRKSDGAVEILWK